ncbi:MAG: hypothetical protein JXK16_00630 [Thiotrichales bacterium]|nr:hypothetical protein [Thiotrichales bacterium]
MLNRLTSFLSLSLIAIALGTPSLNTLAEEDTPNYTLEVIVFDTYALKSWTEEYWPEALEPLDYEGKVFLSDLLSGKYARGNANIRNQPLELKSIARKMSPDKGYKILFHKAWSQDTGSDLEMPTVIIESAEGSSQLSGTIKLYKSRFAHVDFDLRLDRRIPDRIKTEFLAQQKFSPEDIAPETWQFELKESRKIRPNQLHYIDHPLFGIIVQLRYNGPAK